MINLEKNVDAPSFSLISKLATYELLADFSCSLGICSYSQSSYILFHLILKIAQQGGHFTHSIL